MVICKAKQSLLLLLLLQWVQGLSVYLKFAIIFCSSENALSAPQIKKIIIIRFSWGGGGGAYSSYSDTEQSTTKEPVLKEDKGGKHLTKSEAGFVPRTWLENDVPFNEEAT